MNTKFYTCTLLPEVTRYDPPKLGVRCNETGVRAAFWREEDRALFLAAPDLLEALEAIRARIDGEWDSPALVKFGGLRNTNEDIHALAMEAIAKATEKAV